MNKFGLYLKWLTKSLKRTLVFFDYINSRAKVVPMKLCGQEDDLAGMRAVISVKLFRGEELGLSDRAEEIEERQLDLRH